MKKLLFILALIPLCAHAQMPTASKDPIEITADNFFEWQRANQKFVAKGNAQAVQGTASIKADTIEASYADTKQNGMQLSTITATNNVILKSQGNTAYGDKAVYDSVHQIATITGNNLKITTPSETITVTDRFEYQIDAGKIYAVGNTTITKPKTSGTGMDTLRANRFEVTLKNSPNGKREVEKIEAFDNVVITTPDEKVTGNYAIYRAAPNTAEMQGNIIITRGPNILTGDKATVDLTTNESKIYGGNTTQQSGGRVKGVFYPGSQ